MLTVTLILRLAKGSPLDNSELDGNFTNLKNAVEATAKTVKRQTTARTSAFTLAADDAGEDVPVNSASGINVAVPLDTTASIPEDTIIFLTQEGAGTITLVEEGGVTLLPIGKRKSIEQGSTMALRKVGANNWRAVGVKS